MPGLFAIQHFHSQTHHRTVTYFMRRAVFSSLLVFVLARCAGDPSMQSEGGISADLFRHHYITKDAPVDIASGHGVSTLADFDGDGDLDYTFALRGDSVYWMEFDQGDWRRHAVGPLRTGQLGGAATDVDADGHPDIVIGGFQRCTPLMTFRMDD